MGDPGRIAPLSVTAAAQRLGLSDVGTRDLIKAGKLPVVVRTPSVKLAARDVEDLRVARRDAALEEFTRRGVDMVRLAANTRRALRPELADPLPGGARGLSALPANVRAFFGAAPLMALTLPDRDACGWCAAKVAAGLLKVPEPRYGEVFLALLGKPCAERCMPRFAGPEMAKLRARVGGVSARPTASRTAPVTAAGPKAPATPAAPRRTPALPVQDDDGKSMVASALRTARARQKDARRRGDQARMLQLAQTIRGLEQDAAAVDGRSAAVASARPGKLACGHLLSAGCGCPRRSSSRGRR